MANSIVRNPMFIDTWDADVTLSTTPIKIKKIRLLSAAAGDLLYLEDKSGNQVALLIQETNGRVVELDFGNGQRFNGLQIDVSDCTGLGSGDKAWIYLTTE